MAVQRWLWKPNRERRVFELDEVKHRSLRLPSRSNFPYFHAHFLHPSRALQPFSAFLSVPLSLSLATRASEGSNAPHVYPLPFPRPLHTATHTRPPRHSLSFLPLARLSAYLSPPFTYVPSRYVYLFCRSSTSIFIPSSRVPVLIRLSTEGSVDTRRCPLIL